MLVSPLVVITSLMVFILLLFSAFLFYRGRHVYSNVLLGFYLLSQVIGILNGNLFLLQDYLLPKYVHLYLIGYPIIFIWLVLYYFFVCSLVDTRFRIKAFDWLHFIPFFIVVATLLSQFYFKDANEKLKLLEPNSSFNKILVINDLFFSIQIVAYNVVVIIKYYGYRKRVKDLTNIKPEYDSWIRIAIFTFLGACIITFGGKLLGYLNIPIYFNTFYLSNIAFLFFYSILFFVSITSPSLVTSSDKKEKYWYSSLSNYESKELLHRLNGYINETQVYRKSGLTLKELASSFGASERHLSQVINDLKGQNFFDFINSYRVEHAKQLLSQNNENRRTMFDIFWESGFNSKTTFNTAFKKFTGITPSEFQKSFLS